MKSFSHEAAGPPELRDAFCQLYFEELNNFLLKPEGKTIKIKALTDHLEDTLVGMDAFLIRSLGILNTEHSY